MLLRARAETQRSTCLLPARRLAPWVRSLDSACGLVLSCRPEVFRSQRQHARRRDVWEDEGGGVHRRCGWRRLRCAIRVSECADYSACAAGVLGVAGVVGVIVRHAPCTHGAGSGSACAWLDVSQPEGPDHMSTCSFTLHADAAHHDCW